MRTSRALTVSQSMLCAGGVPGLGGVPGPGERGVPGPGEGGVPGPRGGVPGWGCTWSWGLYLVWGVYLVLGVPGPGGVPTQALPPLWTESQTPVKI